jgi:hypothetical protein
VFGTIEKGKREIGAREVGERQPISSVWDRREKEKRAKILVGPTFFVVLSNMRRKQMKKACFRFCP